MYKTKIALGGVVLVIIGGAGRMLVASNSVLVIVMSLLAAIGVMFIGLGLYWLWEKGKTSDENFSGAKLKSGRKPGRKSPLAPPDDPREALLASLRKEFLNDDER